jgi:hypothetical protein
MEIFRLIHSSIAILLNEETTLMSYLVTIAAIKYRTFVGQLRAEFLKILILIYLKNQKISIGDLFSLWDFERLQSNLLRFNPTRDSKA